MESIITLVFVILIIIAHIIKAIKETAEATRQQQPLPEKKESIVITRPKSSQKSKVSKQRSLVRQPLEDMADYAPSKKQALSKSLTPQGEGQRFDVDPGTLDAARIVASTIDPTVKPELESITGIYEEGAVFSDKSKQPVTLDITNLLAKPEGIIQAVIFAEILHRPAWQNNT